MFWLLGQAEVYTASSITLITVKEGLKDYKGHSYLFRGTENLEETWITKITYSTQGDMTAVSFRKLKVGGTVVDNLFLELLFLFICPQWCFLISSWVKMNGLPESTSVSVLGA